MDQTLDTAAVARWLDGRLPGFDGPITVSKFDVGQSNPTFQLITDGGTYVLRRKPSGVLLKSAHAIEREFRVQSALADTDVPVPRMHTLCEDPAVIGAPFYVMEHVAGRNFRDPVLDDLAPEARGAVFDEMNRVLAAIHMVDLDRTGLSDYGAGGNYYARQLDRWSKQYRASETGPIPDMERLISALAEQLPEDDGKRTLVHGDFRIDNMLFSPDGATCRAVLDWELSTLGHPYADLAALVMQWRMPTGSEGRGLAGIDRTAHGLPTEEEFVAAYCARTGIGGIDRFGFYLAFCFFRMGAILQGVKRRGLDGNASNPERAAQMGAWVPEFAALGVAALDQPPK